MQCRLGMKELSRINLSCKLDSTKGIPSIEALASFAVDAIQWKEKVDDVSWADLMSTRSVDYKGDEVYRFLCNFDGRTLRMPSRMK